MKKIIITILSILLTNYIANSSEFAGGNGTVNDPFQVATAQQLDQVRNYLNSHFIQTSDINMDVMPFNMGNYWLPIGGYRFDNEMDNNFTGTYDGNGFQINNLIVVQPGNLNVGLFGHIGKAGDEPTIIRNVKLDNVIVIGGTATGALVGRVTGNQNTRIENCSVESGYVRGDAATGGLVGANNSYMITSVAAEGYRPVVFKCSANVSVLLRTEYAEGKVAFGGLVGCNQKGMISNCFSLGEVIVNDSMATAVGGLTGCLDLRGLIINSYASTTIHVDSAVVAGGLTGSIGLGRNKGLVMNSFWNSDANPDVASFGIPSFSDQEMQNAANFNGWDFNNVWQSGSNLNYGYPYFIASNIVKMNKMWAGDESSDWSDPMNWSPEGVPTAEDIVTIPANSFNYPVVSSSSKVYQLTIEDQAQLSIEGDQASLTVLGNLLGSAESIGNASVKGSGTLVLAGSLAQAVPSMGFQNLVIDNHNNVKLAGNITVNGMLKMASGLLDLAGFDVNLGVNGSISETENDNFSSRIYGNAGVIRTIRDLNGHSGEIAGMGLEITTQSNMGVTLIERGHSSLNEGDESKSILRWFNIEPANNSNLDATLVFHYFISELNIYGENDNFSLFRRRHNETEWVWIPSELDAYSQVLTANNVDEFSTWTAGSTDKPLPITLLTWEASLTSDQAVELSWITAAELNNDYFTVERSINGVDFETVTVVAGAGTTSQANIYSALDYNPMKGISYYRLKQTDFNGDFEYSKTVSVSVSNQEARQFNVFPNPSNGQFNIMIQGSNQPMAFTIIDMHGRTVYQSEANSSELVQVSLPQLNKGIYNIIFSDSENTSRKIQIF